MAKSRKGYSVTVADIKNVVNILFLNDKYGRKESIATMTTKAEVSREIFLKILSILEKCLIYLKDHGFHGEIYTTEQSAGLTKKLVYILS